MDFLKDLFGEDPETRASRKWASLLNRRGQEPHRWRKLCLRVLNSSSALVVGGVILAALILVVFWSANIFRLDWPWGLVGRTTWVDLKAQAQNLNSLVLFAGFGFTVWQILRASKSRHMDEEGKALHLVWNRFRKFSWDDHVVSVKRILEAIEAGYAPEIISDRDGSKDWISLSRIQLRNGLTSDKKREDDGGFFVSTTFGKGPKKVHRRHGSYENAVAYSIDGFCIHMMEMEMITKGKHEMLEDFQVLVRYWMNKLCGLSDMRAIRNRFRDCGMNPKLDYRLVGSLMDICGAEPNGKGAEIYSLRPSLKDESVAERLRCNGLLMQYFTEYYSMLDSDDVVMFLAKLVLPDSSLALSKEVLEIEIASDYWALANAAEKDLTREARQNISTQLDKFYKLQHDKVCEKISDPSKALLSMEAAKLSVLLKLAYVAVDGRDGMVKFYRKIALTAYWRSVYCLATTAGESGGERFTECLRDSFECMLPSSCVNGYRVASEIVEHIDKWKPSVFNLC